MAAALVTAALLSFGGLIVSLVFGYTVSAAADVLRHTTTGIFATMLTLLTHSMMMFYFIGKGKAVREAVTEGGLSREFVARISRARKPVFSMATLAMLLTMAAAISGGGVDVDTISSGVHGLLAWSALCANAAALRTEWNALAASARVVAEVDRLLGA